MKDQFLSELLRRLHEADQCVAGLYETCTKCIDSKLDEEFAVFYRLRKSAEVLRRQLENAIKDHVNENTGNRSPNSNI